MPSNKERINEIAELLHNPDSIRSDFAEAIELVKKRMREKYVGGALKAFEYHNEEARRNPSDQVKLLKAYKPFIPEVSHDKIDNLIEMLNTFNAFRDIRQGFGDMGTAEAELSAQTAASAKEDAPVSAANSNPSVHPDGVYDIDEQCYMINYGNRAGFERVAEAFMLMALMNR